MKRSSWAMFKGQAYRASSIQIIRLCLLVFFINIATVSAQIIFQDDFETGAYEPGRWDLTWWTDRQLDDGIKPEIVTSPVRAGKYAVKMRAEYNWNGVKEYNRTELQARRIDTGDHIRFFDVNSTEYWIGFSAYLPADWAVDSQPELIFQLHGNGDGERSPSCALYVDGGEWYWHIRWQPDRDGINSIAGEMGLWREKYKKEKWVDWVIHAVWSYKDDGFMELFKDGESVAIHNGPNCYNDEKGMRGPQTGIYKWPWMETGPSDVKERIVYLDEFKVGGKNSSYSKVAPGGGILKKSP